MAEILTEPVATPAQAAPPIAPTPQADDAPLSAHIEAFRPDTLKERTDANGADTPQERKRHRAAKDVARPEDVPRIRELTGKVKDAETRAEQHARERDEWRTKYEAATKPAAQPHQASHAQPVPTDFEYPSYEDAVAKAPDLSYDKWTDQRNLALYRWDAQRSQQTAAQDAETKAQQERRQAEQQAYQQAAASHLQRMQDFAAKTPDADALFRTVPDTSGVPLFNAAVLKDDNSAELLYKLRQNNDALFDKALLFADGKGFSEANVARMQRYLRELVSAGTTGAVPPTQSIHPAPRPPTPVRTTPVPPTDDPPGESASLRDHQRFFHKKDRR